MAYPKVVEVSPAKAGESATYRNKIGPTAAQTMPSNLETCYDILRYSTDRYKNVESFGQRKVVKNIEEQKEIKSLVGGVEKVVTKTWKFQQLGDFEYLTYEQFGKDTHDIGSGLIKLGMKPKDRVAMYASTSRFWKFMAFGAWTQNMSLITIYDTLGPEGLVFAIQEGEITTLFANAELLNTLFKVMDKVPQLTNIIYSGSVKQEQLGQWAESYPDCKLISYEDLIKLGQENPSEPTVPTKEDVAVIMYTSGSTGNPKGVIMSHQNMTSATGSVFEIVSKFIIEGDTGLMYLPFAHIFGLICDMFATFAGVPVGYGSPRTLTDSQVRNCKGDIAAFRPSILIGVPQVFDSVRKGVLNKIEELSPLSKWIFFKALKTKSFLKSNGLKGNFVDPIFKAVRQQFGGRLRYAVNAGSPVSQAVFNFISNVCCPFVNAYGMTELTGPSFSTVDDLDNTDSIGLPPSQWEFKLVDVPDLGYLTTNTPAQGELWVRGKGVTMGYFKNPEASAETYHPDGWVMTGDVARLNSDGTVSIIDRKKNLAKLSNGEYVALEKLETVYRNSTLLERVCVVVNSEKPKPIAVIYPSWAGLSKFVARKNIALEGEISSSESLEKLKSAMLQELRTEATQSGLKGGELIADIVITKEDWTVENGLLTSAMKLKRKEVQTRFGSEIQNAFSQFN